MTEGKLVRVSPDTMKKLAKTRNGFESPNECINRLLSERRPCKDEMKDSSSEESDKDDQMEDSKE